MGYMPNGHVSPTSRPEAEGYFPEETGNFPQDEKEWKIFREVFNQGSWVAIANKYGWDRQEAIRQRVRVELLKARYEGNVELHELMENVFMDGSWQDHQLNIEVPGNGMIEKIQDLAHTRFSKLAGQLDENGEIINEAQSAEAA